MIYIEKKSVAEIPPASGSVSDTLNVTNKVTNAPSIRLVEELVENMTGSSPVEVPTKTSQLTNDSGYITSEDIPNVPTKVSQLENDSGYVISSYLPTKTSQLTNDSGYITAEEIPDAPEVPTKTSELENDSGFITADDIPEASDVPTKTSQLENDSGYVTNTNIQTLLNDLQTTIYNDIYPIGRVIIDENVDEEGNGTDYSTYLGFTWEKTLKGVSPIGINEEDTDFSVIGNSGGEKTHTQTVDEMPSHTHVQNQHRHALSMGYTNPEWRNGMSNTSKVSAAPDTLVGSTTFYSGYSTPTNQNTGGGQPMNNMHPYKVVAFWKRIA